MATQHPDNASAPWWGESAFISTQDEIGEMITLFQEHSIDEYMWDWEGKYVDESVGEKLFSRAGEFFAKHPLGEDIRLTYRIPAFDGDKMHRMARAFMNVLSLADLGKDIGLRRPPVTEMFLPLTTSADQPMQVRKAFREVADYHRAVFHGKASDEQQILSLYEVTPLVEDVDSLFGIADIVGPYWESLLKEKKDLSETGQRLFLARSDPAMNAGLVPAVLAVKAALSITHRLGEKHGFPVYPIIGTGSLPFRGSVNPAYLDSFLTQYAGVRTYSIQSAFRYDYPRDQMEAALKAIKEKAPKLEVDVIADADLVKLRALSDVFSQTWKPTIEALASLINRVARAVPPRRERLQHIGLFGYSRGIGKVKLPRAIGFTAALYSVGVPPELISTGRGLLEAQKQGMLPLLERYYPALRADLQHAGKYLNRENLEAFAAADPAFAGIQGGIKAIETVLGIELGPEKPHHLIHRNLTSTIRLRLETEGNEDALQREIVEAAVIRKSIG
jgi:phosphoenolpyruvate carboxylase